MSGVAVVTFLIPYKITCVSAQVTNLSKKKFFLALKVCLYFENTVGNISWYLPVNTKTLNTTDKICLVRLGKITKLNQIGKAVLIITSGALK